MPAAELDELRAQLRELTKRVARLEACPVFHEAPSASPDAAAPRSVLPRPAETEEWAAPAPEDMPILPVLGGATLGLAGAYLLRAIAEAGVLPTRLVFGAATLYAAGWLWWAPRAHGGRRLSTTLYSLTAALILSPLLWEATVRFHTVSPWQTSVILTAFTLIGLAVAWRRDLLSVATISTLAGVGTAAALLVGTYDVLPCVFVFLALAAAVETCACFDHWLGARWLTAAAADLSILLATWVVTRPGGMPEGYAPIPATGLFMAQMTLLAIYLSSVTVRTLWRGRPFTSFETGQCALAFLLGLGGAGRLAAESSQLTPALAGIVLLCGAACYAIAFKVRARQGGQGRNFYTYSSFGILLVLLGCRIVLSDHAAALAWYVLALACLGAGARSSRLAIEVHGGVYLLLGLVSSGVLQASARWLLGSDADPAPLPPAIWVAMGVVAAGYALVARSSGSAPGSWGFHAFRVAMAAALVWVVLGLAAGGLTRLYHQVFAAAAGHSYCATLRTGTVVGITLVLAWAGARHRWRDLTQLVYPLMLLGGYRLLADDLHQERKAALFLSLLLYGATLILLPVCGVRGPTGKLTLLPGPPVFCTPPVKVPCGPCGKRHP